MVRAVTFDSSIFTLPCSSAATSFKEGWLVAKVCPYWRMAPGMITLSASVVAVVCALIWQVPSLCIAFVPAGGCSSYLIYLGWEVKHMQALARSSAELSASLVGLQSQRDGFQRQLGELQGQKEALEGQVKGFEEQRTGFGRQLDDLKGQKERLEGQVSGFGEQRAGFQRQLEELQGQKVRLEAQLSGLEEQRASFGRQLEDLQRQDSSRQTQLRDLQGQNSQLSGTNAELLHRLTGLEQVRSRLQQENQALSRSNEQLAGSIAGLESNNRSLEAVRDSLKQQVSLHVSELGVLQRALENLQRSATADHASFASNLAIFIEQVKQLQATRAQFEQAGTEVGDEIRVQGETLMKAATLLQEIFTAVNDWSNSDVVQERIRNQQAMRSDITRLHEEIRGLESRCGELKGLLSAGSEQLDQLKALAEQYTVLLEELQAQAASFRESNSNLQQADASLSLRVAELASHIEALKAHPQPSASLHEQPH